MKKNNKKMSRLFALCLLGAVGGLIAVSGTYAKYTTTLTGTDSATVAKWSWEVNDNDFTLYEGVVADATEQFTLNLFDTILDSDEDTDKVETNVKTGKIAPGTRGKIAFKVVNNSDVDGQVTLTLVETSNIKNVPIEYSADGENWVSDVAEFKLAASAPVVTSGGSYEGNVFWRWAFEKKNAQDEVDESVDATDTAIGIAAASGDVQVILTSKLTLTQVD